MTTVDGVRFRAYSSYGSKVVVPASYQVWRVVRRSDPSGRRRHVVPKRDFDLFQSTDLEALASSPAGRMATGLYEQVLEFQGPEGNLATLQIQKHPHLSAWEPMSAFWSPDGTTGHRGVPGGT